MKSQKTGFALVIALSLMAFILLLLLSITTLVQVETRSAANARTHTLARMNALLGLQQALGELQQAAGHDQRVTATGSLWEDPQPGTEHYVGVWSSVDADDDGEPDGAFQRWLVSNGDMDARKNVNFVTQNAPIQTDGTGGYVTTDVDYVVLVGGGSAAQVANPTPNATPVMQGVAAKKVPINGNSASGNFAWWVGDNGVKATVTEVDPYQTGQRHAPDWPVNANTLSMQGTNVGGLNDFSQLDYGDADTVEKLLRISNLSDLQLVESTVSSQVAKEHFHDLTTTSRGLQTNTRHGGLKRDLSLLFEMSDADFDDPNGDFITAMAAVTDAESEGAGVGGEGLVYEVPEGARWVDRGADKGYALIFKEPVGDQVKGDGVIYGPTWDMLRSYYRLYKGVDNKSSIPTLQDGWAQTYQPSKASMKDWGQLSDRNENKMARYSLVAQGIRHEGPRQSPELVRSTTVLKPERWVSGVGSDADYYPIRATRGSYLPYLTRMTMSYGITSVPATATADTYDLDIIWQPMLTFHNPYNVSIDMPRIRYATGMEFMKLHITHTSGVVPDSGGGPAWDLNVEYEAGDAAKVFNYPNDGSPDRVMIEKGKELVFEMPATTFGPGEVKVFSVSGQVIDAGDPFYVTMTTNPPSSDTDGVHFDLPSAAASTWKKNTAPDLDGLVYNIPAENVIQVRLQIKKETKFAFDVWNEEQQAYDNLNYYRQGSTAAPLYGNTKWDGQPQDNYEAAVQNYESSVIPNLVMDFYIKPLTFDENLYGGDLITNVQDNRKVYPNFIATNPMAASFHDYGNGSIERQTFSSLYHCYAERFTSPSANHPRDLVMNTGDGSSSWGYNHGDLGPQRSILLDLPIAPMQSIGQFQHATTHSSPYFPVMAVGHSFSSPFVPYTDPGSGAVHDSDKYSKGWANGLAYTFERIYENPSQGKINEYAFYDLPYLLNEALWDGYYFSSIAPEQNLVDQVFDDAADLEGNQSAMASSLSSVVDEVVAGDRDLANARMRLFESAPIGGSVTDDLKDFRYSAQHLAVSGSFNVNSTSVSAWTALLSGYRDALIKANDDGSVSDVDLASDESGFPGMSLAPGDAKSSSTSMTSDDAWAGFMKLKDDEVADLAVEIVGEIKERAAFRMNKGGAPPVLSLGEFVNRMHTDDTDYSRSGILQKAIEESKLNDGLTGLPVTLFETANFNQDHTPKPYDGGLSRDYYPVEDYSIDVRNVSPLALTQADILQVIGPVISARSDTFTIRSYGNVEDAGTGDPVSQAWCEAIVQRTTEETEVGTKRRRFKIVSFRWLEPEQI
jgi:hypothetical protein